MEENKLVKTEIDIDMEINELMGTEDMTFLKIIDSTPLNRRRQIVKGLEIELYQIECMLTDQRQKHQKSLGLSEWTTNMETIALLESVKARTQMRVAYMIHLNSKELEESQI